MRIFLLLLLGTCVLLSGCGTAPPLEPVDADAIKQEQQQQTVAALRHTAQQRIRLHSVAYPILIGVAQTHCANEQRYSLGLMLHQMQTYPEQQQSAVKALYGSLQHPTLLHVLPASSAVDKLHPGDSILRINQQPAGSSLSHTLQQIEAAIAKGQTVSLTIQRDGQILEQSLSPKPTCHYPVRFSRSDSVNGYADGQNITINAGMLRFANDAELALIIAHELAHNVLKHTRTEVQRVTLAGLVDLMLISSGIPSPGIAMGLAGNLGLETFELQADRLAIEMLATAGYPLDGLADFWRRLGREYPHSIHSKGVESHPGTAERYLRMQQYILKFQTGL